MKTLALLLFLMGLGGTLAILLSPTVIDLHGFGHQFGLTISVSPLAGWATVPLFLGGLALWFYAARGSGLEAETPKT